MRKKITTYSRNLISHPLFSGSAILFLGSNIANFLAYVYHIFTPRLLGRANYGELAAIISVIALISATYGFLNMVIGKFVSSGSKKEVEHFFAWVTKRTLTVGIIACVIIFLLTPQITHFLNTDSKYVVLIGPIFLFSLVLFVYRAFLQGLLRFKEMVVATNLEMGARLLLGVVFILLGLSVFGAVLGILLATVVTLLLTQYYLRDYKMKDSKIDVNINKLLRLAVPIFLASLASHSMYTSDVVLVKHYFSSEDAGLYAALSNLSKIIFFGTAPVVSVMFPMISKKHAQGEDYNKIFIFSLLMVGFISIGVSVGYLLFPEFAIMLLYTKDFLSGASYLFWFGLFITIFTFNSLFVNYFLAREKNKVVLMSLSASIGQVLGIWLFHDSIFTVIKVSIITATLFLLGLLIYFAHENKKIFVRS